ncbi:unnamed protein product [Lathyrus oleraceus]
MAKILKFVYIFILFSSLLLAVTEGIKIHKRTKDNVLPIIRECTKDSHCPNRCVFRGAFGFIVTAQINS